MKRIGKSKTPLAHQLNIITDNLKTKLKLDYARIAVIHTNYVDSSRYSYQLVFQPGIDNTDCSIHEYFSWPELLEAYFKLMKGETII